MAEKETSVTDYLTHDEKAILSHVQQANKEAERAYWWMKEVDKETAGRLGVADMVCTVLGLLQKVDNITMDITIKISKKQ